MGQSQDEILRRLSPEEYEKVVPITDAEIDAALAEGRAMADAQDDAVVMPRSDIFFRGVI